VDVPLVSTELLEWLVASHEEIFMVTQTIFEGKNHPLIAIYDRSMRMVFGEHIAAKQLKLCNVIDNVKHQTIVIPEKWSNQVQNINTQEEYQNLLQ
jgi:molybdopterin-guanine dinucleotide biosynthesis protein A